MTEYICAVCKKDVESADMDVVGMRCKHCGSKIFYKKRPNIKKRLLAR